MKQHLVKTSLLQTRRQREVAIQVLGNNRSQERTLICNNSSQSSITANHLELKECKTLMVEFKLLDKELGTCFRWAKFRIIPRDQKTHSLENLKKIVKLSGCINNSRTKADNTFSTDAILDFKIRKIEQIQKQLFNNKLL